MVVTKILLFHDINNKPYNYFSIFCVFSYFEFFSLHKIVLSVQKNKDRNAFYIPSAK